MAVVPPIFSVKDAIVLCGVLEEDAPTFGGQLKARRFTMELFQNSFKLVMRKTKEQLYGELKAFLSLTLAQGQICVTPGVQSNIKAFTQWTRDKI